MQSTKKSVAVPKLSTSEQRFKYRSEDSPGPGEYTSKEDMESKGAYYISKYGSSGAQRFGKSGRSPIVRNVRVLENPGPGTYSMPSEFGYYEIDDPTSKGA